MRTFFNNHHFRNMKYAFVFGRAGGFRRLFLLLLLVPAVMFAQKSSKKGSVEELAAWMQGTYSSYAQSVSDTAYFNITLSMHPIWQSRTDGKWLYVEQAVAAMQYRPYRQRVYQLLEKGKNTFESRVYTLPNPERFIGQWNNAGLFSQLTPDSLTLRDGCAITLRKKGNAYTGQTNATTCPSDLRGAAYATSKVALTANTLNSWDQGFDNSGKQVWGATKGPYLFVKPAPNSPLQYPAAKRLPQTDNYHGTNVNDPYRWMEEENNPDVKKWVTAENELTNKYIANTGFKPALENQLKQYFNYPKMSSPEKHGDYYYFYKNTGLQNHSVLYRQKGLDATPEVFLDPNNFSPDGSVSLSMTAFSHDNRYMTYATSVGGSDWREFRIIDLQTGNTLPEKLENIKFSGADWLKDGFFYTRFEKPEEGKELSSANQSARIYYHKAGTPQADDVLVYENNDNPKLRMGISVTNDEDYVILSLSEGSASGNSLFYALAGKWQNGFNPLISSFEHNFSVVDNIADKLLIETNYKAPNYRLILIDPSNPTEQNWTELVPEKPDAVLDNALFANNKLLLAYMKDVSSRLYIYNLAGQPETEITLPALGIANGFSADRDEPVFFYSFESFMYPPTIFKYDFSGSAPAVFYKPEIPFNFDDYETQQVFYPSKDGTLVPMFITHRKKIPLNGQHPCLLYSYGGFNISRIPEFKPENLPFYAGGGIYTVANLRGGAEYGETWHKAGMLEKKQNVFDDYIAAAQYLISHGYTRPEKLAATGRSNGGLLIGAVMNQRPDLFAVALPVVGVMDMLRFHKFTIGWAWVSEYGSADNPQQFPFLYAYSPYHNIQPQLKYPATLVMTADRDDRVVPAHSYKYTAALQHAYKGPNPMLIRIDTMSGHGGGGQGKTTTQFIQTYSDVWSFVFKNLGMYPAP